MYCIYWLIAWTAPRLPATPATRPAALKAAAAPGAAPADARAPPPARPRPQGALCDDDAGVRTAAGGVFNVLFKSGGGSAMDSVIPALLGGLDSEAHSAQVGRRARMPCRRGGGGGAGCVEWC